MENQPLDLSKKSEIAKTKIKPNSSDKERTSAEEHKQPLLALSTPPSNEMHCHRIQNIKTKDRLNVIKYEESKTIDANVDASVSPNFNSEYSQIKRKVKSVLSITLISKDEKSRILTPSFETDQKAISNFEFYKNVKRYQISDEASASSRHSGKQEFASNQIVTQNEHQNQGFVCETCDTNFKYRYEYNHHLIVHAGDKPYKCPHCNKGFLGSYYRDIHMRTQHNPELPFPCSQCQTRFKTAAKLRKHMWTHRDEKSFDCPQCDERFKYKRYLKQHLLRHSDTRSFECSVCNKKWITKAELARHMRSHLEHRPFRCTECEKAFKIKGSLKNHLLTHQNFK